MILTFLTAIALAVALASVKTAAADPSVDAKQAQAQDVLGQIQEIDSQLSHAIESYNLANVKLDAINADLKANARHLTIAKSSLRHAQTHLSARLVSLYVNGNGGNALEVLLGAESLDDLLNRMDAVERVSDQDARVLREVKSFRAEVKQRKLRLDRARTAQAQVVAQKDDQRRSIEGQLAERQRLLSSIKSEIASLQAAEQLRQQRLVAQAQARLGVASAERQSNVEDQQAALFDPAEGLAAAPDARYGGVVGIAMQYLGVPYSWGGAEPVRLRLLGSGRVRLRSDGGLAAPPCGFAVRNGRPGLQGPAAGGRPRLLQRARPRRHLHRRRPVRPRPAQRRRGQDLEPLRLLVREYLVRRPPDLATVTPRRKFWGWGYEGSGLDAGEFRALAAMLEAQLGVRAADPAEPPRVEELALRPPRIAAPSALEALCTDDPHERAGHAYGKSYRDLVRALRRDFPEPPDLVALPESEQDVAAILDWCTGSRIAVVPYGGGSSVVGGVEPDVGDGFVGAVSLDLRRFGRVLHVDERSRAAEVEAGVLGPSLEDQLQPHGLTFRHFPQSFEFSTLGGWIATRSGGHYATGPTHVDEQVEALTVVTPAGMIETRRLPAGGAGPAPERLFCGSEGALGVITRAWIRLQERTTFRAGASVRFGRFEDAVEATRAIARSSLRPANCRLLDRAEALLSGSGDGTSAILILGFESADRAVDAELAHAVELCRARGGAGGVSHDDAAAATWRSAFLRLPYVYEGLVRMGMLAGSVETAVTWDRFEQLHVGVTAALEEAGRAACGRVLVACRFAYVYPDGPAPYYTFVAPARAGAELEQWDAIKNAVSRAILDHGGTITHHHAVGRDHRPWYDEERPELFAGALRAAKRTLDPGGILNPGVLLDS